VVQEAYLRGWKGSDASAVTAQFTTWMYGSRPTPRRTMTQRRRRQQVTHIRRRRRAGRDARRAPARGRPESAAALEELSVAVSELPPKLRAIIVLKDVYGLSHEDIAAELGISVAAAKVRLHRGRKKLRTSCMTTRGGRPVRCEDVAILLPRRGRRQRPRRAARQRHIEGCLRCRRSSRATAGCRGLQLLRTQYLEPAPGPARRDVGGGHRGE